MKILLVCAGMHNIVSEYATKKIEVINKKELELKDLQSYLQELTHMVDGVIITDEAFSQHDSQDKQYISLFLQWLTKTNHIRLQVIFLTQDFMKKTNIKDICASYPNVKTLYCDYIRIPESFYKQVFEELKKSCSSRSHYFSNNKLKKNDTSDKSNTSDKTDKINNLSKEKVEKKKSFLDCFRSKSQNEQEINPTEHLTKQFKNISCGISKIVAITGHRRMRINKYSSKFSK